MKRYGRWLGLAVLGAASVIGCATAPRAAPIDPGDAHRSQFGEFELPQKIGTVPNLGIQLPVVSPDGTQVIYLRTDRDAVSPMTILGSADPKDTPAEGSLSLWVRPTAGTSLGERISRGRWAHSAAWSPSGRYVAYVAVTASGTAIVRREMVSGQEETFGNASGVNILPTFDGADDVLLFCHAETPTASFEVCRQRVGEAQPTVLTPQGADCVLPVLVDAKGRVICGQVEGTRFSWAACTRDQSTKLGPPCGPGERPLFLNTWAGITVPVSPDRNAFLYYDLAQDRVAVYHLATQVLRRHRMGSVAACWLTQRAFALATPDGLFAVDAETGASVSLLSGRWIPLRYVAKAARLYLLTSDNGAARLSVYELAFRPNDKMNAATPAKSK
jgi:sugar lactone lactonase YvrE